MLAQTIVENIRSTGFLLGLLFHPNQHRRDVTDSYDISEISISFIATSNVKFNQKTVIGHQEGSCYHYF